MILTNKIFIFTELAEASYATLINNIKTFREALYWHLPFGVGTVGVNAFTRPVYLVCFVMTRKLISNAKLDIVGCERYTSTRRVVGSCKSCIPQGRKLNSLFVGAFSLSLLSFILVIASVLFSFVPFSFKPIHTISA